MPFKLDNQGDLRQQVCNAAATQLDKAIAALGPESTSVKSKDHAVHAARKRLKEVRALVRLVRKGLGKKKSRRENKALRDAAHPLSEVRDAAAILEAFQTLKERYSETVSSDIFSAADRALRRRRAAIRRRILLQGGALTKASTGVKEIRNRVWNWDLKGGSWRILESGLYRAYKRGRRAMVNVSRDSTDENLHEWRKRAKDLRYQLELLEPLQPEVMKVSVSEAEALTDQLGDDHDLAVLRSLLDGELKDSVPREAADTLKGLIEARRTELQRSAATLGEKLFAESADLFVAHIHTYWKTAV